VAIERTTILSVRVTAADGTYTEFPWKVGTRYLIRDDQPFLDLLVSGQLLMPKLEARASAKTEAKASARLRELDEPERDGGRWQRWDIESELARNRRFGEVSLRLKVPKDLELQCYVVPAALLNYRDVVAMLEDIEEELGFSAAWDLVTNRPERSWSRASRLGRTLMPPELVALIRDELVAAHAIRRHPFVELEPHSRRGTPLAENAVVSHWAAFRYGQLQSSIAALSHELDLLQSKRMLGNPEGREAVIDERVTALEAMQLDLEDLKSFVACLGNNEGDLGTPIHPSPLFQRDHRLRLLLRAFAPLYSEAISEVEASMSHYPPVFLNRLWELWGAVWLAKQLRHIGFSGPCSTEGTNARLGCSWILKRGNILIELDFEPEPTLIDYKMLPPARDRDVPALEWAACNQPIDTRRPFLGTELRCSPDYLLRITTGDGDRFLLVGDATLASPSHHRISDAKPTVVEHYRQTIGWSHQGVITRCHPLGGFVIFPPPPEAWVNFEKIVGASDCTIFCPSPQNPREAAPRLMHFLAKVCSAIVER
jgi:hypothetical protein